MMTVGECSCKTSASISLPLVAAPEALEHPYSVTIAAANNKFRDSHGAEFREQASVQTHVRQRTEAAVPKRKEKHQCAKGQTSDYQPHAESYKKITLDCFGSHHSFVSVF